MRLHGIIFKTTDARAKYDSPSLDQT